MIQAHDFMMDYLRLNVISFEFGNFFKKLFLSVTSLSFKNSVLLSACIVFMGNPNNLSNSSKNLPVS
ncbi:MAG: hypothetical protein K2N67_08240 [Mucispirillum sp.]|nr:hypothetical protein [Mucispirillum sp.]